MKRLILAFIFIVLVAPTQVHAQDMLRNLSADDVESLLKDEGYSAVEILSESSLRVRVDGRGYLITIFDDGDLQLYYGISGTNADMDDVNTWNRTKRLSRAYIDLEGDPVVESDLLADRGITRTQFANFMTVFHSTVSQFRDYVSDL